MFLMAQYSIIVYFIFIHLTQEKFSEQIKASLKQEKTA